MGRKKSEMFVKKVYVSEIENPRRKRRSVVRWKERMKVKWEAHVVATLSCGRSSPVTLVFEPVVKINPLHWDTGPQ